MKSIHIKSITGLLVICLCFLWAGFHQSKVYAVPKNENYLVLIQHKNASWTAHTNLVELSTGGNLMIKAKRIAKGLGLTYEKSKGSFVIKKSASVYNTYTMGVKEYTYTNVNGKYEKTAADLICASEQSGYNLCPVGTLDTLVHYKCFNGSKVKEYDQFDGIICFSRYKEIPDSVPIVEVKTKEESVVTPEPEPTSLDIEGVKFPVRTTFLATNKVLSDWGGTISLWSQLKLELDGKIIPSTCLWYDSKTIGFSHQGVGFDGVTLSKSGSNYKLTISVKLNGSAISSQNASIVKAMVATISSQPNLVYEAIFDSFTLTNTHGINKDSYVAIGDCKLKVTIKDGIITYNIKEYCK